MQNWKELYKELAGKIKPVDEQGNPAVNNQGSELGIPQVKWVDLWNSQIYNLDNEHPFPTPAIFMAFRGTGTKDMGLKVQEVDLQVDFFIFWETFLDTFKGAYNQTEALDYLDTIDQVNKLFHGSSGTNYSSMRRVSFSPVDTMGAGNLFNVTYSCKLIDYSAADEVQEGTFGDLDIEPQTDNKFIVTV